jgi:hypothetical protein
MYSNKLVACVKANGKILREKGEEVYLPFGSEYGLYFKNEHTRKVQINVEIDGQDVLFGSSLLLEPGKTLDLEGYVRDMYGDDNRAFKFITKTQEISDFRGDRIEDGLIKVTYQFEKEKPEPRPTIYRKSIFDDAYYGDVTHRVYTNCGDNKHPFEDSLSNISLSDTLGIDSNSVTNSVDANSYSNTVTTASVNASYINDTMNVSMRSMNNVSDEPGITVEGSATGQSFQQGYIGVLESSKHTMVFQLRGLTSEEQVQEPVTVKSKKQCPSCGKKWKSSFEYCPHDGTFLRFP